MPGTLLSPDARYLRAASKAKLKEVIEVILNRQVSLEKVEMIYGACGEVYRRNMRYRKAHRS